MISLSAGAGEQCFTQAEVAQWNPVLQAAQRDRVTVVVSTGDSGAADPGTGMALAFAGGGQDNILIGAGGTSAAAPLWAAVIALADQDAGRHLGFVNPALYQIGRSAHYHQAFHDITTGNNTVKFPTQTITGYQAAPGWDPVTGWGSPNAQALVPLLARYASP